MAVTIEQIKQLREATGVSMSSCKTALEEANGNFEEAITVLRKKGEAKAADRAERSTTQGSIAIKVGNGKAAMVELQCETDFASRSDDFVQLTEKMAEKLLNGEINVSDRDVSEVKDIGLKVGEKVGIGEMALVEGEVIGDYVHSNKKIGVLVALKGGSLELAKDLAMHAAATNPKVISPDEVPQELVDKEREIWVDQMKNEKKPPEIIEKIMLGKEKKFREENALIKQQFVKNPDVTIENLLKDAGATLVKMVRFGI